MTPTSVKYRNESGDLVTLTADSVVACGGMTPLQQQAIAFASCADRFFAIGDCNQVGNIHTCTRSAYAAAGLI